MPEYMYQQLHGIRDRLDRQTDIANLTQTEIEGVIGDMHHIGDLRRVDNKGGGYVIADTHRLATQQEMQIVLADVEWWAEVLRGRINSLDAQ